MKASDKKAIGKQVLNGTLSFVKGIAGGINPILGAVVGAGEGVVKGIQNEKANNLASEVGGEGKIDIPRLAGMVVFVLLVIAFAFGYITLEDVKTLVRLFNSTQ